MKRSTLFSVLLIGSLLVQEGAYGLTQGGSATVTETATFAGADTVSSVGAPGFDPGSFTAASVDSSDSIGSTGD